MKFVCDSCNAQYMINDEKVGPNGVIVRCKKCQHKIVVKRPAPVEEPPPPVQNESTMLMNNPLLGQEDAGRNTAENPIPGGIDDELGKAFDSVLAKDDGGAGPGAPTHEEMPRVSESMETPAATTVMQSPVYGMSGTGGEGEGDRLSTRVVNLAEMASLIRAESNEVAAPAPAARPPVAEEPAREKEKSAPPAVSAEWYVAINDSQVGPLDLDGVRARWDKGELSADSLCWKAGMGDWMPLSDVRELADKLAPRPTLDKESGAGAFATGMQSPATVPPKQEEPGEPEWKPSAASALESLVKDELDALQKPAPKAEAPMVSAPRSSGGGLMDELPDIGLRSGELEIPSSPPEPVRRAPPVEEEAPAPVYRRSPLPAQESTATSPPSYVVPPPKSRLLPYALIGIPVTLLAVAVIFLALRPSTPPQVVVAPAPIPPAAAPASAPAAKQPVAAAPDPKEEAKAAEPEKAPEPEKAADKAEPKAEPAAVAKAEPKPEPKAEQRTAKAPPREAPARPAARPPPQPREEVASAPPPPPPSGNKVDDDFDKIFGGGGGGGAAEAPPPKKDTGKGKTVYIPPAPGAGAPAAAAKTTLEQSDVMEVVIANRGMIKKCTDEAKAKDPEAGGTIVMRWTIRQDGSVTNIGTETPEFQKTPLSACLTAGIKTFRFPPYSGPLMAPIKFPFKF